MKLNLNDLVQFTITLEGLKACDAWDARLGIKQGCTAENFMCKPDTLACECHLWELMMVFGPSTHMGMPGQLIQDNSVTLAHPNKEVITWETGKDLPDNEDTVSFALREARLTRPF